MGLGVGSDFAMEVPRTSCRAKQIRCRALAPVVEHYEAPEGCEDVDLNDQLSRIERVCPVQKKPVKSSMRILSKLRDAYVKLMNDIASGADFTGVASFYGCPATDYSTFESTRPQLQEKETRVHAQLARPRQFSYIS